MTPKLDSAIAELQRVSDEAAERQRLNVAAAAARQDEQIRFLAAFRTAMYSTIRPTLEGAATRVGAARRVDRMSSDQAAAKEISAEVESGEDSASLLLIRNGRLLGELRVSASANRLQVALERAAGRRVSVRGDGCVTSWLPLSAVNEQSIDHAAAEVLRSAIESIREEGHP